MLISDSVAESLKEDTKDISILNMSNITVIEMTPGMYDGGLQSLLLTPVS